jgi:hypothetical protein
MAVCLSVGIATLGVDLSTDFGAFSSQMDCKKAKFPSKLSSADTFALMDDVLSDFLLADGNRDCHLGISTTLAL